MLSNYRSSRKKKMKKVWRLQSKPTVAELKTLVEACILTKEEAKDVVLREEEELSTDHKDQLKEIKEELKFLRDMVLQLSKKSPEVVYKHIYDYVEKWPNSYPRPYWREWYTLCSNTAKNVEDNITYNAMSSLTKGEAMNNTRTSGTINFKN